MMTLAFCILVSLAFSPLCSCFVRSLWKIRCPHTHSSIIPLVVQSTATTLGTTATLTSTQLKKCSGLVSGLGKYFTKLFMSKSEVSGQPLIKKLDERENLAILEVVLSPEQTQKAFDTACEMFNDEVKTRGYKVI